MADLRQRRVLAHPEPHTTAAPALDTARRPHIVSSPLIYAPARSGARHAVRSARGGPHAAPGRANVSVDRR
jgi:hypothetical protein